MKENRGFTLIELVVVMGILIMLFSFASFNFVGVQRKTSINSFADDLVSDIASQQTKAMVGVGTSSGDNYGIYFQSDKYILFKGTSYSANDPNNFTVSLDSGSSFSSVTFPGSSIIFSSISGELNGFSQGQNTVTIKDLQSLKTETITVNRYGVVTSEN
ncbi:MAG TPA: type II secretion system protein [Candidatus Sulfotelmatobacter sp.]|nr:type II secretion system protein [Candidatus Sulfotelmatobacter sp.]